MPPAAIAALTAALDRRPRRLLPRHPRPRRRPSPPIATPLASTQAALAASLFAAPPPAATAATAALAAFAASFPTWVGASAASAALTTALASAALPSSAAPPLSISALTTAALLSSAVDPTLASVQWCQCLRRQSRARCALVVRVRRRARAVALQRLPGAQGQRSFAGHELAVGAGMRWAHGYAVGHVWWPAAQSETGPFGGPRPLGLAGGA